MIIATDPLDIDNIITSLHKKIEPFTSRGSGWNISKIQNLSLCIGSFHPTAGSSFIPTPAEIKKKMAIINIRNHNSNNSFQYSVLAAVHPATSNLSNPYTYNKFMKVLDMTGIKTPVALSSIPKFESQNSSISINVLVYEEKELIPVYTSTFCNQRPHHVNLLLLSKGDKFHYTLVTSLSRLVGGKTRHGGKIFVCPYCMHPFWKEHCLQNHLTECSQHPAQTILSGRRQKHSEIRQNSTHVSRPICYLCRFWIVHNAFQRTCPQWLLLFASIKISPIWSQNLHVFCRQCRTGIFKICNTVTDRNWFHPFFKP